jgi:hypothetical protein
MEFNSSEHIPNLLLAEAQVGTVPTAVEQLKSMDSSGLGHEASGACCHRVVDHCGNQQRTERIERDEAAGATSSR